MWIRKFYRANADKNVCLLTLAVFVFPAVVALLPYVIARFYHLRQYDLTTWFAIACAGSWFFLGPILINKYFISLEKYQEKIVEASTTTNDLIEDEHEPTTAEQIERLIEEEKSRFNKRIRVLFVLWGSIVLSILLIFNKRLSDFAFYGFTDVFYWVAVVLITFLLYLQAIGFSAIIMTHRLIKSTIAHSAIVDDVLESSFEDGSKILGTFLLNTALCFFSGIVFFPVLIIFSRNQSVVLMSAVIFVMLIFVLVILIFFLTTYRSIWVCMCERKKYLINEFRLIYNAKMKEALLSVEAGSAEQILEELKILNIYNHIKTLEQIDTNPIEISKTIATVITIVFPVLFFVHDFLDFFTFIFELLNG